MSYNVRRLHSHSGIERDLCFPKSEVLVDSEYKELFPFARPFVYNEKKYYIVNILTFVKKGGVFLNLYE